MRERNPFVDRHVGDVFRVEGRLLRLMAKDRRRRGNLAFATTVYEAEDDRGHTLYFGNLERVWPPDGAEYVGVESKAKWERRFKEGGHGNV